MINYKALITRMKLKVRNGIIKKANLDKEKLNGLYNSSQTHLIKKNHDLLKNFVISLLTVTKQPSHLYKINVKMSIENRREINPGLITNVYLIDKFIPKKGTETLKQKVVETL